jgi:hypothetical protein
VEKIDKLRSDIDSIVAEIDAWASWVTWKNCLMVSST